MKVMKETKISVIVPVYNVEKYLRECLDSLVSQTMDGIELIVVNDGSPDNSQQIIDEYSLKYPEMIKAYTKENGGLSDARNYGLLKAEGEYVMYVDSDDYIDVTMCEKMYEACVRDNAEIGFCGLYKQTAKGKLKEKKIRIAIDGATSIYEKPELLRRFTSYACNKIFKKSFLAESKLSFPDRHFEDSAVIYNYLALANRVVFVDEPLYFYRTGREGAITVTVDEKIFDIFQSCNSIIDFYKGKGIFDRFYPEIEYLCIIHLQARLNTLEKSTDYEIVNRFVEQYFAFMDDGFPDWRVNKYYREVTEQRISANKYKKKYSSRNDKEELEEYLNNKVEKNISLISNNQ